jgi:hypothetical protein
MVNAALKARRSSRLQKHTLVVHAAVAALYAFALNVLWHTANFARDVLKIVQCRAFVHGTDMLVRFTQGAPVVQQVAFAPKQ